MALAPVKLPRINPGLPVVDGQGRPTVAIKAYLDSLARNIENAINAIVDNINSTAAAVAAAAAAQAAADAAALSATAAQSSADSVGGTSGLNGSYVVPTQVLTASDAGASATITIANHTRVYADGTSHAVTGGALTGLAYQTGYSVYYDDATRAASAVTYHTDIDPAQASPSAGNPDRHYVGSVGTPAALGSDILGIGAVSSNVNLPADFFF